MVYKFLSSRTIESDGGSGLNWEVEGTPDAHLFATHY